MSIETNRILSGLTTSKPSIYTAFSAQTPFTPLPYHLVVAYLL